RDGASAGLEWTEELEASSGGAADLVCGIDVIEDPLLGHHAADQEEGDRGWRCWRETVVVEVDAGTGNHDSAIRRNQAVRDELALVVGVEEEDDFVRRKAHA